MLCTRTYIILQTFFDKMALYFAEHALNFRTVKNSKDLLSFTCVTIYFSAIQNYYLDQFQDKKARDLPCFDERVWTQYYQKIGTSRSSRHVHLKKKVIDSKNMATLDEVKTLAVICLWADTTEGVSLFCLNKLLFHLGARCCKAADQWEKKTYILCGTRGGGSRYGGV